MEEKINFEYEVFVMDCMRQSKSGIYARSEEIEAKKEIARFLKKSAEKENAWKEKVMALDNILEEAYRYVKDYRGDGRSIEVLVEMWLESL